MELIYEANYRMRTNDFTCHDLISPTSILDSFQDVAGNHASILGMGFNDMVKKGYYWVVSREKVSILNTIEPGSTIKVITWPEKKKGASFTRNYKIINDKNEVAVVGSSIWCVINTTTRRLERARDVDYEGEIHDEIIYDKINKLDENINYQNEYGYLIKFSDLDHNKHMNNSKYMDVFLDIMNLKENEKIVDFQLDFVHEGKLDEILKVKYTKIDNRYYFAGFINDILAIRSEVTLSE